MFIRCLFRYCLKLVVSRSRRQPLPWSETFGYCSDLESTAIPDSVESIGDCAFAECKFSSIKIPRSVTSFGGVHLRDANFSKRLTSQRSELHFFEDEVLMDKEKGQVICWTIQREVPILSQAQ